MEEKEAIKTNQINPGTHSLLEEKKRPRLVSTGSVSEVEGDNGSESRGSTWSHCQLMCKHRLG